MKNFFHDIITVFWISMYPFLLLITEIWDYKYTNTHNTRKTISKYDSHKAFKNKNTNEMTGILTNTLMNIFKNFTPHKTKTFDSKHLQWMNSYIISSLKKRAKYPKRFYKN